MKRCACCYKLKPETAFAKEKRAADGLAWYCKACKNALRHGAKVKEIRPVKRSVTGGLKITVQNYAKANESRFNIYDTDTGEMFRTNVKELFFERLKGLMG